MEFSLELSDIAIDGLKLLNHKIDEEITKKLIVNVVKQLLIKGPALPARPEIYNSKVAFEAKQADFAVCSLLLLASKHQLDVEKLREILENHKVSNQTVDQLVESYEKFKEEIVLRLSRQGNSHNIPELTNVSVEIQQRVPSNELVYKVNFLSFDHQTGCNQTLQEIFCNQEELQSMINKLKDVERHCEKLSK